MIKIDGSQGEGGGQIFRTSLTLSACLGEPVTLTNIRVKRRKPGLLRQHLTCLNALTEICNADVSGAELGSQTVTFIPQKPRAGRYRFAIASAGSASLVFQTVMMPLLLTAKPSLIILNGGTHNGSAPSFDFIRHSFLPALNTIGIKIEARLSRYGFYPCGGGEWQAQITPLHNPSILQWSQPDLATVIERHAIATSAQLPDHIVERELERIRRKCGFSGSQLEKNQVDSVGPGNVVSLRVRNTVSTQVFEAFGERGVSAEKVAGRAIKAMSEFVHSGAVVNEHLADQLLLPLVLCRGGSFLTSPLSLHCRTNMDVIQQITGVSITTEPVPTNENTACWRVSCPSLSLS